MRYDAMTEDFEEITVFNKPALFTNIRIDKATVPKGLYMYEVRHNDDWSDPVQNRQKHSCKSFRHNSYP